MPSASPSPQPANETGRATGQEDSPTPDRRVRARFHVAVAVTVAPILIAAVRAGLDGWFPTWRAGYVAVMTNDVFTAHTPLVGPYAATSSGMAQTYNFPGAIQMYLLAVPVKLLGIRWGMLLGTAAVDIAAVCTALWLIRRRVGHRTGLLGCLFVASLTWSLGGALLVDATPLVIGLIPIFLVFVAAWSVADGDPKALVPLAAAGNYLLLAHLKFTVVIPLVTVVALTGWARTLRHQRRRDPAGWPRRWRTNRRGFTGAVLVTVAAWAVPIGQQLFSSRGNLGRLIGATGASGADRNLLDTVGVVFSTAITWPLWLRDSFEAPNFDQWAPTTSLLAAATGAGVAIAITVAVLVAAHRRRDPTVGAALIVVAAAYLGWIVSASRSPSPIGYYRPYYNELWPLAAFWWMVLAIGAARALPPGGRIRRVATIHGTRAAMAGVVILAAATIPHHPYVQGLGDDANDLAAGVFRAVVEHVPDRGPVFVDDIDSMTAWLLPAAFLGLQERGIAFRVDGDHDVTMYGPDRAYRADPPNAVAELQIRTAPVEALHDDLLAVVDGGTPAILQPGELTDTIERWGRNPARVRVPPARGTRADELTDLLNTHVAQARRAGIPPTNDPGVLAILSLLTPGQQAALVGLPAADGHRVAAWIEAKLTAIPRVWIYLTSPPGTRPSAAR